MLGTLIFLTGCGSFKWKLNLIALSRSSSYFPTLSFSFQYRSPTSSGAACLFRHLGEGGREGRTGQRGVCTVQKFPSLGGFLIIRITIVGGITLRTCA